MVYGIGVVTVRGRSMEPTLHTGDRMVVLRGAPPRLGRLAIVLLRFVAFYSLFDMMSVLFAAALKGAGDTTYPLLATLILSWTVMVMPSYLLCAYLGAGVYTAWTTAAAYCVCVGVLMFRRFRGGRWKALRVIETPAFAVGTAASR